MAAAREVQLATDPDRVAWTRLCHSVRLRGGNPAGLTLAEYVAVYVAFGGRCAYCSKSEAENGRRLDLDHVLPLSRGGTNVAGNVAPSCRSCNSSKRNRTPEEWLGVERAGQVRASWPPSPQQQGPHDIAPYRVPGLDRE